MLRHQHNLIHLPLSFQHQNCVDVCVCVFCVCMCVCQCVCVCVCVCKRRDRVREEEAENVDGREHTMDERGSSVCGWEVKGEAMGWDWRPVVRSGRGEEG